MPRGACCIIKGVCEGVKVVCDHIAGNDDKK